MRLQLDLDENHGRSGRFVLIGTSAYDFMSVHDASGLHVTWLKWLKWANREISVNGGFK
jgi:hypothetical protein